MCIGVLRNDTVVGIIITLFMERKIGEIFELGGEWYQCIIGHCNQCSLNETGTCKFIGDPYCAYRNDNKLACFKKLEKVGEPYVKTVSNGTLSTFQRYRVYNSVILPKEPYIYCNFIDGTIEIEIKQNKEDMEGKKIQHYDCFFDGKSPKSNLKPFDLKAAKAGKPVCTREGRKARIIYFDAEGEHPIIALVTYGVQESPYNYTKEGYYYIEGVETMADLMMLPEKKEGWVNVYKSEYDNFPATLGSDYVYNTKEEAINNADPDRTIATVKISWEEKP